MRLFKAIIVSISLLFATLACAGTTGIKTPGDAKGYICLLYTSDAADE